jgi:ferrochelatase
MKWLTPATDAEIRLAGAEGRGVLIAPIAFVSEHVETLVELDHDYARLASEVGCRPYLRAAAPGVNERFVHELAQASLVALNRFGDARPHGPWLCPSGLSKCVCDRGERR